MGDSAPPDVVMSAPDIGEREKSAVLRVLDSGRLSMGHETEVFEQRAATAAGVRHAIAVSSGTAGLHLAVRCLAIGRGDVVVTTSFSFAASTNCFLYEGATPAFADIDERSLNVDPESIRRTIHEIRRSGQRPRAILPVHVFGQPCDMRAIRDIAREEELAVIEDACEAVGAEYEGRPAGSFGDLAVFAFYPNKQMTTGEGGVIVTDSEQHAELARSLRNQGRGVGTDWFEHVRLGYNYRLDELSAALGAVQFDRLQELLEARARVAASYNAALARVRDVEVQWISPSTTRMSWFVYVVRLAAGLSRSRIANVLADRGIQTRPYFVPIHQQPYLREMFGVFPPLPVTEDVGGRTLALPFHGRLTDEGVGYVVDALERAIGFS